MSRTQKLDKTNKTDADIIAFLQKQHAEDQVTIKELHATIDNLQATIKNLQNTIVELNTQIKDLIAQLNLNSKTSSLPPSHDLVPPSSKNRSLRKKTGKKVGGQPNHKGVTRELVDNPDEINTLTLAQCPMGHSLEDVPVDHIVVRQVFEIPIVKTKVIEYQAQVKYCPECKKYFMAEFPKEAPNTISFGPNLQADIIYNRIYQSIPINKIVETYANRYSLKLSNGTIESKVHEMASLLAPFTQEVKDRILTNKYIHCDETGVRIDGKRQWLHTIGTPNLTIYHAHEKRGAEAMIENGVLPKYFGTIMSDYWLGYNKFPANHTYCKAHIIRETRWVSENFEEQKWAGEFEQLLNDMYIYTKILNGYDPEKIAEFEREYDRIIDEGLKMNPVSTVLSKNGRPKKSKIRNLLERLKKTKKEVLLFLHDPEAPYTNNLAERDLRPTKVQQKISGCYRSMKGAEDYCAIKGYLSTVAKNGKNIYEACEKLARREQISLDEILTP